MKEITLNNETYILKTELEKKNIKINELTQKILSLENKIKNREEDRLNNKYKQKYDALNKKYRTLYMKYKHQSDRMSANRQKYIEIIHKLQCEIINQASIEDLIKEVDRMSEIEKEI